MPLIEKLPLLNVTQDQAETVLGDIIADSQHSGFTMKAFQMLIGVLCKYTAVFLSAVSALILKCRFIPDPEPHDFFALTETAPRHQHGALRNAIAQHLAFSPSMEVNLSVSYICCFSISAHTDVSC